MNIVKLLIENGASVNTMTKEKFRPLNFPTNTELIELLIRSGGQVKDRFQLENFVENSIQTRRYFVPTGF